MEAKLQLLVEAPAAVEDALASLLSHTDLEVQVRNPAPDRPMSASNGLQLVSDSQLADVNSEAPCIMHRSNMCGTYSQLCQLLCGLSIPDLSSKSQSLYLAGLRLEAMQLLEQP